jgi:hypothetical protein
LERNNMLETVPLEHPDRLHWRFQGNSNSCWLTAIEIVMFWKHGNIYGVDSAGNPRSQHADHARQEAARNQGSRMSEHAADYGLIHCPNLRQASIAFWRHSIQTAGPIIVSGRFAYGPWVGLGNHFIVVVGVSASNKLAYYNPNLLAVVPHPDSKLSYMTLERCRELVHFNTEFDYVQCQPS